MTVFNKNKFDHLEQPAFFGRPLSIARYDKVKYPIFDKLTDKQLGFFWRPEEIDISRDSKDFKGLTDHEKFIFTSNLKRQILLDSVQGRAPVSVFLPITSLPELENWIVTWSFFETIHSRSYTHIIRNIYSNPSEVFDTILDIEPIVDCAKDISVYYDTLDIYNNTLDQCGSIEHKRALWLALNAVNALEGVRFYVSFACSWAFAELKKMEGNAKIIKFIARDENVHLASTQQLLKILPKEDKDFAQIAEDMKDDVINMFDAVVQQEMDWAKYLFKDGSMIGLNKQLLCDYVEWIANRRLTALGIKDHRYKGGSDPLPWTQKWISGSDVQVAPQEVELTSYIVGGLNKDVNKDTLSKLSL